ncbi:MAG: hypothetical protein H6766_06095 [Candidatus Peribacteria bacterium]|nr:MAG: hypothetical protein H6766_06095 [Candidatus Peribacteria bacterium]
MFGRSKQWIVLTLITLWIGSSIARGAGLDDAQFLHNTASFFSLVLDVLYVILWPLLIVAGWALDNSLVLGEVFHLDNALWQFWVIVRNLANFALGFIVIWMIAKHLWGK